MVRSGRERFTEPTLAAQRRYEALRAWWVEGLSATEIAERFGYSKGSVQTLISRYRGGGPVRAVCLVAPGAQAPAEEGRRA